ncbi:MAG: M14 family metallopeptidase [Acidobacteriota bacterium]|nr:M14 family metallopeptidase [Acidobacteriota bacterium]
MFIYKIHRSLVFGLRSSVFDYNLKLAFLVIAFLLTAYGLPLTASAQTVPTPKSVLGFHPTDDRTIADWKQISDYFAKLDKASPKVKVEEIGKTTLGKSQIVAYISSAENIKNLESFKQMNKRLTNPYILSEGEHSSVIQSAQDRNLREIANYKGKTIVAISCSIHSTEIVASQMSMLLAHQLATGEDTRTKEILDNTILLLIPSANPDGIDIVADWYRKTLGTKYEGSSPPELYHHYAGHDNNRDWFMMNLAETRNITKLFWQEWFPQIVYDVHQQGQTGARMTLPPFFDPPNPRIDPLILRELGLLGYKMAADLQRIGQAGVTTNATYDTWWHGGFRSAPYYHNSIGILSEAASADLMSPVTIKKEKLMERNPTRGITSMLETATNIPDPWEGGEWHPRDIARIEMTASMGVLEMAAKFRERYLENARLLATNNLKPDANEPQAFIVYAGQPNEERVARFLEILMWQGMEVHEMTRELEVALNENDKMKFGEIPAGSFIVMVNQPQKPNVLSLFEKQIYPERINANGEAEVPYDVSGWTLPLQMGVEYVAAWKIKDFSDHQKTLKKVENINQVRKVLNLKPNKIPFDKLPNPLKSNPKIGMYKGWANSMDEGWTRLVFDNHQIKYTSLMDMDFRVNKLNFDTIILPSISEKFLLNGRSEKDYPKEYTGGMTEAGVENLKKFVENGGELICFDDSCELVINKFGLPMKNTLKDLNRKQFYSPGTILEIDVDTMNPLAKGFKKTTPAYFINSSAFEITDNSKVKSIAEYGKKDILLSGWIFGEKYLNAKTAIAEANYGKGKIILFGFRPQHRGQTYGTFQFLFNALEK